MSIATAVLEAYARWGTGPEVTGEWADWRARARPALYAALAAGDAVALDRILCHPEGRIEWNGLMSPTADIEGDVATWAAITGETEVAAIALDAEGHVLLDSPRHDAEAFLLLRCGARRILEIGGGYGGMAWHLWRRAADVHLIDVDLADTLYLAYGFLAPRLPPGAVVFGYDPAAVVSLVPSHNLSELVACDVAVNFRGFGEMPSADVARYFALFLACQPRNIVHENACAHPIGEPEAMGTAFLELLAGTFPPLPGYVLRRSCPSPWSAGDRYQREEWERA